MMKKHRKRGLGGIGAYLAAVLLFALILAVMLPGTLSLGRGASAEGVAATRRAIERAAVLCYATEGFYPPSLAYIETNYGVQVDRNNYTVRYEVFAPGIAPAITVVAR